MTKVTHFFKRTMAKLTGDQTKVIALDNQEMSISLVESQISELQLQIIKQQREIRKAEERLDDAKYPKQLIDENNYLAQIRDAEVHLSKQKAYLETLKDNIVRNEALLAEFKNTEEA